MLLKFNTQARARGSFETFGTILERSSGNVNFPITGTRTLHTRRLLTALVLTLPVCPATERAEAGEWMFRRSYYTHEVPRELRSLYPRPASRSAYRPALVRTTPGLAVRSAHRFNRILLRSGNSSDLTIIREHRHEFEP